MAALGSRLNVWVKESGRKVIVPDNDVAKLMYYLYCVTLGCGMDIIQDDLVDYAQYYCLSATRKDAVFKAAFVYSPDEFKNKPLFVDEDIPGATDNTFYEVNTVLDLVAVQENIMLGGTLQPASKVIIVKEKWLENNYYGPMRQNLNRVLRVTGNSHLISSEPARAPRL